MASNHAVKIVVIALAIAGALAVVWIVLGPMVGGVASLFGLGAIRSGQDILGQRSGAAKVVSGLADSKAVVGGLASGERATAEGLDRQAKSLGVATGSIDDGLLILQAIAKRGPTT